MSNNDKQGKNPPDSNGVLSKGNQRPNEQRANLIQKVVNKVKDKVDSTINSKR
jgi:hypothetical protein